MNNLKKIRELKELTQEEVAKVLNVTKSTYSRYEREERKMDPDTLKKLSEYFDLSIDYIVGNIEEPLTLTDIRFRDNKEYNRPVDDLIDEYNFVDEEGKELSLDDIKKMLDQIRANLGD